MVNIYIYKVFWGVFISLRNVYMRGFVMLQHGENYGWIMVTSRLTMMYPTEAPSIS